MAMQLDSRRYRIVTEYLLNLYQCRPFIRQGIDHPVTVYYPDEEQTSDVDSVLDPSLPRPEARDFAAYDHGYLHELQSTKSGLYNGSTFTMQHLSERPLRLRGAVGRYFDMLATTAALDRELRAVAAKSSLRAPSRAAYHREVDPERALRCGLKRSATIGICTLIVFNDQGSYKAMLARRSEKTAFEETMFQVLPTMTFQPTTPDFSNAQEWSVRHQVLREVLEELFDVPEPPGTPEWDHFYRHPALIYLLELLKAGQAQLDLTGVIINLLTLRPEVATLLLIHDPRWYARITAANSDIPLRIADEFERDSVMSVPMMDDADFLEHFRPGELHLMMPVHVTAVLWLGIDRARAEIRRFTA